MNFRGRGILVASVFTVAALGCVLTYGQMGPRHYDPSTETTVQGSVTAVNTVAGMRRWTGLHLTVQSADQKYDVHVGPSTYVDSSGFKFAEGDQVEVVGSKVDVNGTPALIAREIRKDGKVLSLRDKQGFPLWSGGRRMAQ